MIIIIRQGFLWSPPEDATAGDGFNSRYNDEERRHGDACRL